MHRFYVFLVYQTYMATDNRTYFVVDVSNIIGREYKPMIDDMARMITIQIVIQTLIAVSGGAPCMSEFVLLTLYVVLGVAMYWLVVKSVVSFI
jgi:hypothetical protein